MSDLFEMVALQTVSNSDYVVQLAESLVAEIDDMPLDQKVEALNKAKA